MCTPTKRYGVGFLRITASQGVVRIIAEIGINSYYNQGIANSNPQLVSTSYKSANNKTVFCIIISSHRNGNYISSDNAYPLVNENISGTKVASWEERALLRETDNPYLHTFVAVWKIDLSVDDILTCSDGLLFWILV